MKTLNSGQEKLQNICAILKAETLEPAKNQAHAIIKQAEEEAKRLIQDAAVQAEKIIEEARALRAQERTAFQISLEQAIKQSIEKLKEEIEKSLFNEELHHLVNKESTEPKIVARLITALINALEKEGTSADFTAIVSKTIPPKAVVAELTESVLRKLKDRTVQVGQFEGGVKVRLVDKQMTLDISDEALKELLSQYRKDFRTMFFK